MNGFINVPRSFFAGPEWEKRREFSPAEAVIDLQEQARFTDGERDVRGRIIPLRRGELVASVRYLSNRWAWSTGRVERFLNRKIARQELRRETRQGESVLILEDYEDWQGGWKSNEDTDKDTDKDKGGDTDKDKGGDTGVTKQKKGRMEEGKKGKDDGAAAPTADDLFIEELWEMSVKRSRSRTSKVKVRAAWKKIPRSERPPRETVLDAYTKWKDCEDWTKKNGEFVPALHRWINERQWENIPPRARGCPPPMKWNEMRPIVNPP